MRVEYHPAVQAELDEILNFYEGRRPGLGREFLDEFERLVLRVAATPRRWMAIEADIRRALMPRFPYVIYFREVASDRLRITVVKYARRHPGYGRDRR